MCNSIGELALGPKAAASYFLTISGRWPTHPWYNFHSHCFGTFSTPEYRPTQRITTSGLMCKRIEDSALGPKVVAAEVTCCLVWRKRRWKAISRRNWGLQLLSTDECGYSMGMVAAQHQGRGKASGWWSPLVKRQCGWLFVLCAWTKWG